MKKIMVMSNIDIVKAIDNGDIKIEPDFDKEKQLQPATIDLRLGKKVFKTVPDAGAQGLDEGDFITVEPSEFMEVLTYEWVELSKKICGRIGLKSEFTRKGLYLFSGPQIDPGFKGVLALSLFNTSTRPITIKFKQTFCTIELSELKTPANPCYEGKYQEQKDFNSEDISWLMTVKGMTFAEVVNSVKALGNTVSLLNNTVKSMKETYRTSISDLRDSIGDLRNSMLIYIAILSVIVVIVSILPKFFG